MRKLINTVAGAIAGFLVGLAVAVAVVVTTMAVLWLFVFGDSPWPDSAESIVGAVGVLIIISCTLAGASVGYRYKTKAERRGTGASLAHGGGAPIDRHSGADD